MFAGFKQFILRGNVIDLAVAVVIGAAFTAIVNALVDGLINPLVGLVFQVGDLESWVWKVPTLFGGSPSTFVIGSIIAAAINFFLVALVVYFAIIAPMNRVRALREATPGEVEPETLSEQELLVQIRDLLAKGQPR